MIFSRLNLMDQENLKRLLSYFWQCITLPALPMRTFSFGTTTSDMEKPAVLEQRCPMFSSFRPLVKPGESASTMKPVKALEAGTLRSELEKFIQSINHIQFFYLLLFNNVSEGKM